MRKSRLSLAGGNSFRQSPDLVTAQAGRLCQNNISDRMERGCIVGKQGQQDTRALEDVRKLYTLIVGQFCRTGRSSFMLRRWAWGQKGWRWGHGLVGSSRSGGWLVSGPAGAPPNSRISRYGGKWVGGTIRPGQVGPDDPAGGWSGGAGDRLTCCPLSGPHHSLLLLPLDWWWRPLVPSSPASRANSRRRAPRSACVCNQTSSVLSPR